MSQDIMVFEEMKLKTFIQLIRPVNASCNCKAFSGQFDILKTLIEQRCGIEDSAHKPLPWFPEAVHRRWQQYPQPLRRPGLEIWREQNNSREQLGYVDAYAEIKNCRRAEACDQLAKTFHYDTIYNPQFGANPKNNSARKFCAIRDCRLQLFPNETPVGGEAYHYVGPIHFLTPQKQLYVTQILYQGESGQEFMLPGYVAEYSWPTE